ncbi:hypothetical protein HMPREF9129_1744 [Peptoniphilus indolicus ATCC 29427]|uniref:Uncharacterized protein n=1 Tax=Peptoniphilus indolicus ATCC 29427 TaxID=997350 RepID=G4D5R4_9FIRM|nr:hypothetical protein HMPREF9129_1744 [Peptoniphilus indolicus ATCC 29427]
MVLSKKYIIIKLINLKEVNVMSAIVISDLTKRMGKKRYFKTST